MNLTCVIQIIYVIGYTRRYLHQLVNELEHSIIGNLLNVRPSNLRENFTIVKKCRSKLFEMLYIRKKRPKLNTQVAARNNVVYCSCFWQLTTITNATP